MNGTTGQPAAGQFVSLLALRGQMVPVRDTQTNSQGRYRFVVDANPSERFLVQVPFRGVNYSQPALFTTGERITADITVYETGAAASDLSVEAQTIFLEPHIGHLRVSEFYSFANRSRPPRAFAPAAGSFRFALPGPVGDLQVSAGRSGGMLVRQQPQPADAENSYAIHYAFRPGESEVQVSYALPLAGTATELRLPLSVATPRRHLAVPREGLRVQATGLKEIVQTEVPHARVYAIEARAAAELKLRLEVDPAALAAAPAATPAAPEPETRVSIVAHPVNRAQWYIVGLSFVVLSLGLYYLSLLPPALRGEPSGQAATDESTAEPGTRPAEGGGRRPH